MSSCGEHPAKPELHTHLVQLYTDPHLLVRNVSQYLHEGLQRGEGILVIATAEHREAFARGLTESGADPEAARRDGRMVFLDAETTLARFMVDGQPDWDLFKSTVRAAMQQVKAGENHTGLRAYGEMVGILWTAGQHSAAIALEGFWNKLMESAGFSLYCAYPIDVFGSEFHMTALDGVLSAHTHLLPTGTNGDLENSINRGMSDVLGSKVEGLRLLMGANFRPAWAVIPGAEAVILWLRRNLPESADKIIDRARQHYEASRLTAAAATEH